MSYSKDYKNGKINVEVSLRGNSEICVTHEVDLGNSLAEMVEKWGEEVVYTAAGMGMKNQLRSRIYAGINSKEKPVAVEDMQKTITTWTPKISNFVEQDPASSISKNPTLKSLKKALSNLSKEEQLAKLQEMIEAQAV